MVIHDLQTEFRLLIAIIHMTNSNNIVICAQIARVDRDIFMRVYDTSVRIRSFSATSIHLIASNLLNCHVYFI